MPNSSKHSFGALETSMTVDQSVAVISVHGVVSPQVADAYLGRCELDLSLTRAQALVAHYDQAQLNISAEALLRSAQQAMAGDAVLRLPTALVIRPEDAEMWRLYCDLQGRAGVMRQAFTSEHRARQWAELHAALWAEQARYRAAAR